MTNPLSPNISLLVKLGSIVVHVDEMLSPHGHEFDKATIETLLSDSELQEWIKEMTSLAFLPVKRGGT